MIALAYKSTTDADRKKLTEEAERKASIAAQDSALSRQFNEGEARRDAIAARFASIVAAVKDAAPASFENAPPSLVRGRKALVVRARAGVDEADRQVNGGAGYAPDADSVGVVV